MSIEERVRKIVCEQLGVGDDEVKNDSSFVDDLGADSLDTVELVMAITSSTVSSESAPRSSTNDESFLTSSSPTPSCSQTIFLTLSSILTRHPPFKKIYSTTFQPKTNKILS